MYDVHLRLIEKPIVDFVLVIIELISLGVMAEAPRSDYQVEVSVFEGGWVNSAQNLR